MPRYPSIVQGELYLAEGSELIAMGTPAWSDWIREQTTFSYRDGPVRFTARREQRPGSVYWYAYKRTQGKLLKRYLGRGEDLTFRGLQEIAQQFALRVEDAANKPTISSDLASVAPGSLAAPSSTALLVTKCYIPGLPVHHIVRSRLFDRLDEGAQARLTLVCAPAGAGKTTQLAAWARVSASPVGWLSLEEADNDPRRFLAYLLVALTRMLAETAEQDSPPTLPSLPQGVAWEETLTPLVNELARALTKDAVLILDDYHLITNEPIHVLLRFLIEHAPPQLVNDIRHEQVLPTKPTHDMGALPNF